MLMRDKKLLAMQIAASPRSRAILFSTSHTAGNVVETFKAAFVMIGPLHLVIRRDDPWICEPHELQNAYAHAAINQRRYCNIICRRRALSSLVIRRDRRSCVGWQSAGFTSMSSRRWVVCALMLHVTGEFGSSNFELLAAVVAYLSM